MELLLRVFFWLWQLGWAMLAAALLWGLALWLIRPLRRRRGRAFAGCLLAVALLLGTLCARPVVVGEELSAPERQALQQRCAGLYSHRIPGIPVVCTAEKAADGTLDYRVWYFLLGSAGYTQGADGLACTDPLF